ncbi:MAG: hypothetical protein GY935_22995 [Gammaproteobacteria bacterium]|nr:hypothetical protein [Gammaproteobacteria bacterium]
MGNYDFDRIAHFARKRFIEGFNTVTLLELAGSEREKKEIAFVSLLDVDDDRIRDLQLCCGHVDYCSVIDCRDRLKKMIEKELELKASTESDRPIADTRIVKNL